VITSIDGAGLSRGRMRARLEQALNRHRTRSPCGRIGPMSTPTVLFTVAGRVERRRPTPGLARDNVNAPASTFLRNRMRPSSRVLTETGAGSGPHRAPYTMSPMMEPSGS